MDEYEGYVKYAGGEIYSVQCAEERHSECPQGPDVGDTGLPDGPPMFSGCYCECGCGHDPDDPPLPVSRILAPLPTYTLAELRDGTGFNRGQRFTAAEPAERDRGALEAIAEMLRDPEWAVGMLEDIAEHIRATGRSVDNYPDGRSTWIRH